MSFSYFAVLQEDVYKKSYNGQYFKYTFLALVAERGVNALIGLIGVLSLVLFTAAGAPSIINVPADWTSNGMSEALAWASAMP